MPLPDADPGRIVGMTVFGVDGEEVGRVDQVFLDDGSGRPRWVTVRTGILGLSHRFVPLEGADADGDGVRVPYDKDAIKDAPHVDIDAGYLTPEDERRRTAHYATRTPDETSRPDETSTPEETSTPDETSVRANDKQNGADL